YCHWKQRSGETADSHKEMCWLFKAVSESLRERAQAGESFELLAREHSESETRHDGGRLGLVPRGRFPADFDRVVFALEVGTPSRAVRTADGVHLFLVTHVLEAQSFSFEDVRRVIARELEGQRREKLLERVSRDLPLPENPIVFEREELESRLRTANARTILLQLGDFQLTASQLQAHLVELRRQLGARQEPDLALRLVDEIRHREIIYQHVLREGLPEIAQDMLERERRRQLIEHYSRQKLARFVEAQPERIQQHFERNALRFAAPPRAHIRRLEVPLQRGAPGLMARLEEARLELDDGLLTLEQLASELDGTLQDLGLVTAAQLQTVDRRATRFAFQLEAGEHSPPYQVGQTLVLFQVAERHEPVPRPLSAVRDQVISDYLGQNASTIFGEVTETLLAEAEFELFHDRLTDVGPLVPAGS
ncbi:MAG: peptidyl-prolyl cis-trans isomerase, partial [Acidobacteriota bacterium]